MGRGIYLTMTQKQMDKVIWERHPISDILGIPVHFKPLHAVNLRPNSTGNLPYVTRTSQNNGIEFLLDENQIEKKFINPKNSITFGAETGVFFYQNTEFVTGNKMYGFYHEKLNSKNSLALIAILTNGLKGSGLGYGYGMIPSRIEWRPIQFPMINGELAWDFLEELVNQVEITLEENIKHTINKIDCSINLSDREWHLFELGNLTSTISGADLPKVDRFSGKIPFIGASSKGNGITDFIDKIEGQPKKFAKNVIGVNRNGSVGWAFYHPYEAYFSGDTRYLILKDQKLSPEIAIFLKTTIMNQKNQFGYGFKLGTDRLRELKINLPVVPYVENEPQPDWQFMHDYISSLPNGDLL
ncbi:restriction endonuclease subunit S [Lactococcus lactis]|uniref:restriction endonuclease subunit S n=1 Tax=Lactococcus lactis TaxID=1358 RepID=UPI002469A261|nr:restriction endonuclease subunit S [Lactococcus lactis]